MGSYTVYILMQNFESPLNKLVFDEFNITKIDMENIEKLKNVFLGMFVYSGQHFIKRRYDKLPELDKDDSGLGRIPDDSEDLMLLLRLFKPGNLVFVAQVVQVPEGEFLRQYPYPMAFSTYRSPFHYRMSVEEVGLFNEFFREAPKWPGWNAPWFQVVRRYFLWGGSKEFHPGRDNERVLDYMIALEAAFVFEGDFVSRRLRERAAAILGETKLLKNRIKEFYDIRSAIAHGNVLSAKQISLLRENGRLFEDDIRKLLKETLKNCQTDDAPRRKYLRRLYDISDSGRAEKIISDFRPIKNLEIKNDLLKTLRRMKI